jgi:AcrR family transcriptional regulator
MVRDDWLIGGDRRAAAADRIYDAATDLALRHGLNGFDVDSLAARMHCSRATIYRYAGSKAQIRDAVLIRLAARVVDTVRRAVDGLSGPERAVTAITVALEQIRSDPMRRLMISTIPAPNSDLPSSPMLGRLAVDLTGIADDDPEAAQWIVRAMLSMIYWPIGDSRVEQKMLQRFLSPVFDT